VQAWWNASHCAEDWAFGCFVSFRILRTGIRPIRSIVRLHFLQGLLTISEYEATISYRAVSFLYNLTGAIDITKLDPRSLSLCPFAVMPSSIDLVRLFSCQRVVVMPVTFQLCPFLFSSISVREKTRLAGEGNITSAPLATIKILQLVELCSSL